MSTTRSLLTALLFSTALVNSGCTNGGASIRIPLGEEGRYGAVVFGYIPPAVWLNNINVLKSPTLGDK